MGGKKPLHFSFFSEICVQEGCCLFVVDVLGMILRRPGFGGGWGAFLRNLGKKRNHREKTLLSFFKCCNDVC
jgi:hypothetical protein